jgi:hypothetical protein
MPEGLAPPWAAFVPRQIWPRELMSWESEPEHVGLAVAGATRCCLLLHWLAGGAVIVLGGLLRHLIAALLDCAARHDRLQSANHARQPVFC